MLQCRRIQEWFERRSGLPSAAPRAVELRLPEVPPADEGEDVARLGIDGHQRCLQVRLTEAAQPLADRLFGHRLQFRHKCRPHGPVRRVIAAEPVAELLPQEFLRVPAAWIVDARIRSNRRPDPSRGSFGLGGDESFLAHAGEHDVASLDGTVVVRPRRERGRRAREARDERAFGERQLTRRLAKQVPRHRLDAVDAATQIDAVQIQLEDFFLGELGVDHQRQHRLADLAAVGLLVRQKQRARELLRERAAALDRARFLDVAEHRASERDRIDARMPEEAVIFDGDERVLKVGWDLGERHVLTVLVHPEPAGAVGSQEPGVANAALQAGDGIRLPERPRQRDRAHDDEDGEDDAGNAVADPHPRRVHEAFRPGRGRSPSAVAWRRPWRAKDSMK